MLQVGRKRRLSLVLVRDFLRRSAEHGYIPINRSYFSPLEIDIDRRPAWCPQWNGNKVPPSIVRNHDTLKDGNTGYLGREARSTGTRRQHDVTSNPGATTSNAVPIFISLYH